VEAALAARGLSRTKVVCLAAVFLVILLAKNSYAVNINIRLRALNGQVFQTIDKPFKNRLLFITVFQNDCDYCRMEVSSLNKLYENPQIHKWFVVLGIDPYNSLQTIAQFKQSTGAVYPLFQANPTDVLAQLHTEGTPTSYVVLNGKVLTVIYGEHSYSTLKRSLKDVIDVIRESIQQKQK